jgi:hypothetical protein
MFVIWFVIFCIFECLWLSLHMWMRLKDLLYVLKMKGKIKIQFVYFDIIKLMLFSYIICCVQHHDWFEIDVNNIIECLRNQFWIFSESIRFFTILFGRGLKWNHPTVGCSFLGCKLIAVKNFATWLEQIQFDLIKNTVNFCVHIN